MRIIERKNLPYYLIVAILFVLLKFAYRCSNTVDLYFLLKPSNTIVEFLTGYKSCRLPDGSFFYEQLKVVINKSCSGFNFMLICFLMLSFLSLKYFKKNSEKIIALLASAGTAYLATIFINSSRIFSSITILKINLPLLANNQAIVHEVIGITTNLTSLILLYLIVERGLSKRKEYAQTT